MVNIFELVRIFWAVVGILAAAVVGAFMLYLLVMMTSAWISSLMDIAHERKR